jgi:MFS family permease
MSPAARMSADELRASISLSSIFGLRMLGMFLILPVFAIHAETLPGGSNLTLVGIALGAYGLTQAVLQIPFGWWSDRYGRKPVIYAGLAIFAAGSFIAAAAGNIYVVILGRVLQGAGAISAAVIAMLADLTREESRAKAMAMIGTTIGATFALSIVAGPWLNHVIGVPGIFALTGVLAAAAIMVVYRIVPDVPDVAPRRGHERPPGFREVLMNRELARLNCGALVLHAVLMSLFIAVPFSLRASGLEVSAHWQVYLPTLLGSFLLMVPVLIGARSGRQVKYAFVAAVALLLGVQAALPWGVGSAWQLGALLLLFFTAFNVLEATLPALATRLAPAGAKGVAIGIFTSIQFFGAFIGAALGGWVYGAWGTIGIVVLNGGLVAVWLMLALGMTVPPTLSTRVYAIPAMDPQRSDGLAVRLQALPGVHEASIIAGEGSARLRVDSAGFDEENVRKLIAQES